MTTQERILIMMKKVKPIFEAGIICKHCKHSHKTSHNEYVCFKFQKVVNWDEHKECFECYNIIG